MGTTTTPGGVGLLGSSTADDAACCSALGSACLQPSCTACYTVSGVSLLSIMPFCVCVLLFMKNAPDVIRFRVSS